MKVSFRKAIGMAIRNARVRAGVTSVEIEASKVISRRGLSSWETGSSPPNVERLKKFSEYIGVSLVSIISEAELSQAKGSKK
jgi:transcriptional regulator with XRE-family HTH domain